jgi:hypothetical protein
LYELTKLIFYYTLFKGTTAYFWDFARGWTDNGTGKGNPMQALERISKAPAMEQVTVFVMKDLGSLIAPGANGQIAMNQLAIVREVKNLAWQLARDRRCLVILSDQIRIPQELAQETTVVDISLPGIEEISNLLTRLVAAADLKLNAEQRQQFIKACQGLTRCRISRVLAKCLVRGKRGKVDSAGPTYDHRGETPNHPRDGHPRIYPA